MSEVFYHIIGDRINVSDLSDEELGKVDINDLQNVPRITDGKKIILISRTAYLRMEKPARFEANDVLRIADRMDCNFPLSLACKMQALLTRDVLDTLFEATGKFIDMSMLFSFRGEDDAVRLLQTHDGYHALRLFKRGNAGSVVFFGDNARKIHLIESAMDENEVCAICLETQAETPGQMWANGCSLHHFHAKCVGRLRDQTCPVCRAPLV
jgi:hypothetical protein